MRVIAEDVSMFYDDAGKKIEVLRNINFEVREGESVAIIGESGVGKTTFLNLIGGLERPTAGEITIGETRLTRDFRSNSGLALFRGRNIGFIFQFFQLLAEFDATENVAMPLVLQGFGRKRAAMIAEQYLSKVGLASRLTHRPSMLSGGEQQRVAIARALVGKPGLILADEPTGNLDQNTGLSISKLLLELKAQENSTLVVVTHSRELAAMMDRTLELTTAGLVPVIKQ